MTTDDLGSLHEAVMVNEVTEFLGRRETVVDMTVGAGGHAAALLEAGVGRVVGVDRDPSALSVARQRLASFGDRFREVAARFSEVDATTVGGRVDGVLYDLGVSSMQLDEGERGFGYRVDGPLDMRMGADGPTASDLVNELPENDLANLIFEYGQERLSRRIARAIARNRPITTTDQLARVVAGAVGRRPGGPHPARRTFQAIRIAVNREIEELAASLPQAVDLLVPGGRVVVISYHSLEDGLVKRTFRDEPRLAVLTKKPQRPTEQEVVRNPRARSALLRAAERIDEAA
ncbi:MAG: 16S rRNA (cytosine(1402)-N(4))-methyltransferase RsmH [Actinomycetota bacterium]|nr:16S rRNA (cytosine(1402)-N(4))-methyltransferase RsmH [Actinomycetota bacterium]